MGLSVWVGNHSYEIGAPSFFNSFFSTIFVRLEQGKWGSRFPIVMRELYSGHLEYEKAEGALLELGSIRDLLSGYPPEQVVWDYEKRDVLPPWGDNISPEITSLADYFGTSDGKDLIDVLEEACREAIEKKREVLIE